MDLNLLFQDVFEGLLTTLTITQVTADSFGTYDIDATNSEGSGTMYLHLGMDYPLFMYRIHDNHVKGNLKITIYKISIGPETDIFTQQM